MIPSSSFSGIPESHRKEVDESIQKWLATPHQRLIALHFRETGEFPEPPLKGCGCNSCLRIRAALADRKPPNDLLGAEAARAKPILEIAEKLRLGPAKRVGKEYRYLCPLHPDHHPSLALNPTKAVWFCGPCGLGGDGISLVMKAKGIGFRDAVRWITE